MNKKEKAKEWIKSIIKVFAIGLLLNCIAIGFTLFITWGEQDFLKINSTNTWMFLRALFASSLIIGTVTMKRRN